MKLNRFLPTFLLLLLFVYVANAQKAEVTISLNEHFFDSLLDAVFQNGGPLEFSIASQKVRHDDTEVPRALSSEPLFRNAALEKETFNSASPRLDGENECSETIKLLREINGVRTAVRFRDGKILAPLAFSGNYNPPFIGCVPFAGFAESVIELDFDQNSQRLTARAKVVNVSLNGTGGVGGSIIAKMVQSSIDKKINPIEILNLDKLSFAVPIQGQTKLNMRAVAVRHEVQNSQIAIHIVYEFAK